jgi:hypothetical protein
MQPKNKIITEQNFYRSDVMLCRRKVRFGHLKRELFECRREMSNEFSNVFV